ncbi:MAG TPA: hypothetical protein VFI82_06165 [Terriglobales bacterium]|nr:hypothetical protein [Terriglobales bacterium]
MRFAARLSLPFFVLIFSTSFALAQGAKISADNPSESQRDRPRERARWFMRGRTVDGKPGAEQLHHAYDQKLNNRRMRALPQARITQSASGTSAAAPRPEFVTAPAGSPPWNFLGPAPTASGAFNDNQQNYGPVVGRVTAVVVDQGDTSGNTVYIGGASGGVWKTTNAVSAPRACDAKGVCTAPVTWTPLTDGQATLTVGSIAIQPGNSSLVLVGTGEANNAADSYYGLGILRSTDAGNSWSLISSATCPTSNPACPASGTVSFHGLGFTRIAFSSDNPMIVVATAAAASAGIGVGAETADSSCPSSAPSCPRGIYYSTDAGLTWTRASVLDGTAAPDPGSANSVLYNSVEKKFYANIRYHGFYASADGANWTRLANQPSGVSLANCPTSPFSRSCPLYRAEMAIVPGRDEMYVWFYSSTGSDQGIFQTQDGGQSWTQISTIGIDSCGDSAGCGNGTAGQGTYNLTLAAVPNGGATDLYAGGVNEYKCTLNPVSNPTCAASPFLNLTHVYGCSPAGIIAHVHPDEHGVDFLGNDVTGAFFAGHPSFSPPVFFGNDGGIYRVQQSSSLASGNCPASGTPPSPFDNLNSSAGFSMIQFVGFSHAAADSTTLVGGTQDNGSPAVSSASPSSGNWLSVNNGDGGFTAINPFNASEWFTSNPAPLTSGGGIQRCATGASCTYQGFVSAVTQDKIGGDDSSFYTFYTLDPQSSGRMLVASCRVWRGNSDGSGSDWSVANSGGVPLSQNFDTGITGAGATCSASTPYFVNTIAAGGPCNGTCDPGITPASGTGGGSQVVWGGMEGIADTASASGVCPNNLPCGGQVWVTTQADLDISTHPNKWTEVSGLGIGSTPATSAACTSTPSVCNINPKHYTVSGIALDPKDASGQTAYVTVMGFGVGHVFKTTNGGATWAKLDGDPNSTGLPDAPADAVVADPNVANLVYVGTDVGVFSSKGDGTWTELGPASGAGSLPNVVITQLKIYNNPSDPTPLRLRASTYGRGVWEIPISPVPGYSMTVSNPVLFSFSGQTATYNGAITTFNGYSDSINITCTGTLPSTCPNSGSPVVVTAPATNGNFSVTAGNGAVGDFSFKLTAVGSDPKGLTQQSAVILHSVDFSLGSVPSSTVGQGDAADVGFSVSPLGQFTGDITLSCPSGLPAGTACTFSPAVVSLTPGASAMVRLTIPTASSTITGNYTVTIRGTSTIGSASQLHSTTMALTVSSASAQAFQISAGTASPATLKASQTVTVPLSISSQGSYAGTLALSCVLPASAGSSCNLSPSSVTLTTGQTMPSTLTVNTTGAAAGVQTVTANALDVSTAASASTTVSYSVMDYSVALGVPSPVVPFNSTTASITVTAQNGYTGKVNIVSCNVVPAPLTCSPAASSLDLTTASSASTNVTITAPANTPAGTYTVTVNTNDASLTSLTHAQSANVTVQDFGTPTICNSNASGCSSSAIVTAGSSAKFNISVAGLGGFNGAVSLSCTSGVPALATCSFSVDPVNPGGSSTLTISTTAPSVAQLQPPATRRPAPLYALWLTMPGIFGIGIVGNGMRPRARRGRTLSVTGLVLLLGILLSLAACGGGGGGSTTTPPIPKAGTPAGTYTIVVTGSSGSGPTAISHSANITLTVN